jgi:hypothetical protein
MAGNVVRNIEVLGAKTTFIHNEQQIKKIRYVCSKYNHLLLRVDENDKCEHISYDMLENIEWEKYDAVVISDYCKGFLYEDDIEYISLKHPLTFLDSKKLLGDWAHNISFIKINSTEIPFLNTSTFVAGRFNWEALSVKFRDPIGPSAAQALMEWVRLHAESVTGRMGYAVGYKRNIDLEMLDPTGVVVEKWLLDSTMLTNVSFGELSMDDDGLAEITATLRFSRAILLF